MIRIQIILAFVILSAFVGCSTGQSPVTPDTGSVQVSQNSRYQSNRTLWGYWTIRVDPGSKTIEIVPDRGAGSHFNVVRLLDVSPCTDCISISNLSWLPDNVIQCDFQLKHPFTGNLKLTGFDVRGILVTDGDTLFPASNRFASFDGSNPTLIDPDGYTALFNPVEFPADSAPLPILGYFPGKFSSGDNFTGTLNPFMAFCKDNPRRMFEAGATETVTIILKYPSMPFAFGYAVDASWLKVDEVVDPVTDFPSDANCLEPYRLDSKMSSVITDQPGDTALIQIEIFDHQGIDTVSTVSIESPSLFDGEVSLSFTSQSGDDSWFFDGVISNENSPQEGYYPVLVRAGSLEDDSNLGELAAYLIIDIFLVGTSDLVWAKRAGGMNYDKGHSITTLSDNSTVVTGEFQGTATFGESEANETVLVSAGGSDIFVARYNPDGTLAWAKHAGGTMDDYGYGITALSDDSTVVTGTYIGSATFGEGEANETLLVSEGGTDIFVACFNPGGTLVWAKRAGGTANNEGFGITNLSDDSTVVTGYFSDSTTFGEGEPGETVLVSDGHNDIFVARYNPDGTLVWAKHAGGTENNGGYGITTLADDTIFVTGQFSGTATFGKGEPNETVLVSEGGIDSFVARYSPDGTLTWTKSAGGTTSAWGNGITTLSDDSTIVTGEFSGTATFGKGESNETVLVSDGNFDIFVACFNPDGTLAWAKRTGGTVSDSGLEITSLSDDSILVTGYFYGSVTFGEGEPNETVLVSDGDNDIFFARYYPDGTLIWAKRTGGPLEDWGNGITTLSDDSTVVTGHFKNSALFGEGEFNETVLASDGQSDIFVARFAP